MTLRTMRLPNSKTESINSFSCASSSAAFRLPCFPQRHRPHEGHAARRRLGKGEARREDNEESYDNEHKYHSVTLSGARE